VKDHHDQIEVDIPKLGGSMFNGFKKVVKFDTLVTTLRSSALVVHQPPFVTIPGRRGIKADVVIHRNGAGSAKPGIGTGGFARANPVRIKWAAKLRILALKIGTVGFHLQSCLADRDTIRADRNAVVISRLLGISQIQVNVRGDLIPFTHVVHGHRIMSRIQKK